MKSHAILRTNVGLTTNAKIMVTGSYSLYVDSINSIPDLSTNNYKKKQFNKDNYWDELLPFFFKNTPTEISFAIRDLEDNKNMSKDFGNQYDDIYQYGARNIIENKDYTEEFEFFAPLFIGKNSLPKNFIIFRVDGPGLLALNKENFVSEIIDKLKFVKKFDLTKSSPLGEWLENNITKNKSFPQTGLFIDFRNLEFSTWNGIDYEDGGYSEKSIMMDSVLKNEQTYQDFEKFIIDGYKNNKVVYPFIYNFSFLFDDTPATPSSIRTWSLNRYLGFYLDDLELAQYVSPSKLPKLKSDVIIDSNNILYSTSSINPFDETSLVDENLYVEISGQFYKVEKFLEQQQLVVTRVQTGRNSFSEVPNSSFLTKYKIISNVILEGRQSDLNKNLIFIDSTNKLTYSDGTNFTIDKFEEYSVWLIDIDGLYHNIIKSNTGELFLNTDYAFTQSLEKLDYYINSPDPNYKKTINTKIDPRTAPKQFGIFRCNFTDIKDFDTDIINTEYSKFEYMFTRKLTTSDETKMFAVNQISTSNPKDLDDFRINGDVSNIPTSSEYIANNSELFRVADKDLNFLWKKNAKRVKWGFQNSLSSNDYPYLLNNSFTSEDYNRTVNPFNPLPLREDRNLDYFLTINSDSSEYSHESLHISDNTIVTFTNIEPTFNNFLNLLNVSDIPYFCQNDKVRIVSDDASFDETTQIRSVSATSSSIVVDFVYTPNISATFSGRVENLTRTAFRLDRYLNLNYDDDYFNYFFSKKTTFDSGQLLKNTTKYSLFNQGDNSTPNITLFRGLKFKIWDVGNVKVKDGNIEAINIKTNNNYDSYKFSILLSKNNYSISGSSNNPNNARIDFNQNLMRWQIIDEWKHDKIYQKDDLVKYSESIYKASTQSQILDPQVFPHNSSDWNLWTENNIFWSELRDGTGVTGSGNNMWDIGSLIFASSSIIIPPLVYNDYQYYYSSGTTGNNFWYPNFTYSVSSVVLHKGSLWESNVNNNRTIPSQNTYLSTNGIYQEYWTKTNNASSIWKEVEVWNPQKDYFTTNSTWGSAFSRGHYVVFNDTVYATTVDVVRGIEPSINPSWKRVYSLKQDTSFRYSEQFNINDNPIVFMNNRLYLCRKNGVQTTGLGSTLENGINIFINKKWKNVLVNIYVNDDTFSTSDDFYDDGGTIIVEKDRVSNTKRDDLYSDIYSKLTANNFMNAINDLDDFYDFSDKIRYIIINEDLSVKIYDFNNLNGVENLPVLLSCEGPDEFLVKIDSLIVLPETLSVSQLKPTKQLLNGEVESLEQINYYSDNSFAVNILQNLKDKVKISNYSSLKNNLYNNLYRHSGFYSPIFQEIELFRRQTLTQSGGNYRFDTELTNFGKIKERIVSKINRQSNLLRLRNNPDLLSVYPMVDEFGYHAISYFIFKSTWDFEYHVECQDSSKLRVVGNQSVQFGEENNNTNNTNLNQL